MNTLQKNLHGGKLRYTVIVRVLKKQSWNCGRGWTDTEKYTFMTVAIVFEYCPKKNQIMVSPPTIHVAKG